MKTILFNENYGLRSAVINGRKTMTRRLMKPQPSWVSGDDKMLNDSKPPRYKLGEVVAIAQPYETFMTEKEICERGLLNSAGTHNSMFAKSSLMPHHIKITNVRVERLQACSDDDILKEGVFQISAPIYRHYNGVGYTFKGWTERGVECSSDTPKGAFKALIDKTCGRGTFESNPYVFVYEFKLID